MPRPDLAGAIAPDFALTPFCNSLAIRRLGDAPDAAATFDIAYVDARLAVTRSRQRYERIGPARYLYTDLGVAAGFSAEIAVDADALVTHYPPLFARVGGPGSS